MTAESGDSGVETVELPRSALRGSRRVSTRSTPLIRTETSDSGEEQHAEIPVPLAEIERRQQIRILHVDDNPQIGELIETYLERVNDQFSVVSETSAVAALDRLRESEIDCVVSDYQMPNTDGLELLEIVRERYPDLPFILFTGRGSEEIASEAIQAGVTDYMQKGTGTDQYEVLANRVENAVDRYRTEQQFWNALSWYQRLVEQELAGVCIVQQREFVYVNRKLAEAFGYSQRELIGSSPTRLTADGTSLCETLRKGECDDVGSFDETFTGVTADGERITVDVSGGAIDYDGERAWIGVVRVADGGSDADRST